MTEYTENPRRGDEIDVTPIFFSIHAGFRAFQGRFFKIAPPWMSNPKRAKTAKTAFLLLLRKAVFSFFRHRQRNDFRLSVRAVLEFDREGGAGVDLQPGRKKRLSSHPFLQWKQTFSLFPNLSDGEVQRGEQFCLIRQSRENTAQPLPPED